MMKDYEGNPLNGDVQSLTPSDVMSVYSGRDGRCCCGCSGKHHYSSLHVAAAGKDRGYDVGEDEVNDKMVTRVLRTVQMHEDEVRCDPASHVAVTVGQRVYILYLTEAGLKKVHDHPHG